MDRLIPTHEDAVALDAWLRDRVEEELVFSVGAGAANLFVYSEDKRVAWLIPPRFRGLPVSFVQAKIRPA